MYCSLAAWVLIVIALIVFRGSIINILKGQSRLSKEEISFNRETEFLNSFKIAPATQNMAVKAMAIHIGKGKDFPSDTANTESTQKEQMLGILDYAKSIGMDSIVLDANPLCSAIFPSKNLPQSELVAFDLLKFVIEEAKNRNLKVMASVEPFLTLNTDANLTVRVNENIYYNPSLPEVRTLISNFVGELAANYELYGIVLNNPAYPSKEFDDSAAFQKYGFGTGLEEFRRRNIDLLVSASVSAVKEFKPEMLAGVSVYGVWGTLADKENGASVTSPISSYNDNYCDSLGWVKKGWVDFIAPRLEWATENKEIPFKTLADWWAASIKDTGIKLMISQTAYKIMGKEEGWGAVGELSAQYDILRNVEGFNGSIFESYTHLKANKEAATALTMAFGGVLDFSTISNNLVVNEPKNNATTDASTIIIKGVCDNNFPLYLNGKEIKPTSKGYFATDYTLAPGKNTLKFEHKGQTQTVIVNYNVTVIKGTVYPTTALSLSGGSSVIVRVTAHRDSVVNGTFNGKTYSFTPKIAEGEEQNAEFVDYTCVLTMPSATFKVQSLGAVSIVATYKGFSATKKTANISVKIIDGTNQMAEVTADYAQCYDIDMTTNNSSPSYFFLPKGTKDYIIGEVSDKDGDLWVLKSGQKVRKQGVNNYESNAVFSNNITTVKVNNADKKTTFTFEGFKNAVYRAGFNATYLNLNKNSSSPNFGTTFDATTFDLILYYVSSAPDIGSFSSEAFSGVQKTKINETTYKYTFTLKEKGKFFGFKVDYNEDGNVYLSVNNPIKLSNIAGKPLTGIKIMLDPGHGADDPGTTGSIVGGTYEKVINLSISLKLRELLKSLGATVVMTRETDIRLGSDQKEDLRNRVIKAWKESPDIFLSIHNNANPQSDVKGIQTYYYYGFNVGLANAIHNSVLDNYKAFHNGNTYNSDCRYQSLHVLRNHQPMALLIECGFMSNPEEHQWLSEEQTQQTTAQAIVNGITKYFS